MFSLSRWSRAKYNRMVMPSSLRLLFYCKQIESRKKISLKLIKFLHGCQVGCRKDSSPDREGLGLQFQNKVLAISDWDKEKCLSSQPLELKALGTEEAQKLSSYKAVINGFLIVNRIKGNRDVAGKWWCGMSAMILTNLIQEVKFWNDIKSK